VASLGLRYVVVTASARDDLADEGAGQFSATIRALKARAPTVGVEVLTPDFHARAELIAQVLEACPDVYSHNVETVRRLTPRVRPQGGYDRSLSVLRCAQRIGAGRVIVKSGFMVGLGERQEEVHTLMEDIRCAGCDVLTVGQYLRPTLEERAVSEFVPPERYSLYRRWARELGFRHAALGPYVRSSYRAFEALPVCNERGERNW